MQEGAASGPKGTSASDIDDSGFTGDGTAAFRIQMFLEQAIKDLDRLMPAADRRGEAERAAAA